MRMAHQCFDIGYPFERTQFFSEDSTKVECCFHRRENEEKEVPSIPFDSVLLYFRLYTLIYLGVMNVKGIDCGIMLNLEHI